jgi:uncharacterized phage protein (TIGR01671 family)
MREIKFRAFVHNKMIYSYEYSEDYQYRHLKTFFHEACGGKLMQSTNEVDKNNNEIWEDDIFLYNLVLQTDGTLENTIREKKKSALVVKYAWGSYGLWLNGDMSDNHNFVAYLNEFDYDYKEIKGNVHENPELLENK